MIKYLKNTLKITDAHRWLFYDNLNYKFCLNFTEGDELGMFASHFISMNKPSIDCARDIPVNTEEDSQAMIRILFH